MYNLHDILHKLSPNGSLVALGGRACRIDATLAFADGGAHCAEIKVEMARAALLPIREIMTPMHASMALWCLKHYESTI